MTATTEVQDIILGKEQVINDAPKVIKELQFGVLYDNREGGQRNILTAAGRIKTS
jgi:hypothetical protein